MMERLRVDSGGLGEGMELEQELMGIRHSVCCPMHDASHDLRFAALTSLKSIVTPLNHNEKKARWKGWSDR